MHKHNCGENNRNEHLKKNFSVILTLKILIDDYAQESKSKQNSTAT